MVLTPRFFLFFALGFLPILGGINDSRIFVLALAYDAGVVAVTVAEWLLLVRKPGLRIRRDAPSVVSIGVPFEAVIYIENPSAATLRVTVKDSPPREFEVSTRSVMLELPAGSGDSRSYQVRANVRGTFQFQEIFYRIGGVTGLCEVQRRLDAVATVKVYPNLKNLSQVELAIAQ